MNIEPNINALVHTMPEAELRNILTALGWTVSYPTFDPDPQPEPQPGPMWELENVMTDQGDRINAAQFVEFFSATSSPIEVFIHRDKDGVPLVTIDTTQLYGEPVLRVVVNDGDLYPEEAVTPIVDGMPGSIKRFMDTQRLINVEQSLDAL